MFFNGLHSEGDYYSLFLRDLMKIVIDFMVFFVKSLKLLFFLWK